MFFIYSDLAPGLDYLIYVIAENGITDQLQLPDRLQSLGTSVTVTTRGGEVTNVTMETGIIRTVVRIVGMGRMSHICNTKCSRL